MAQKPENLSALTLPDLYARAMQVTDQAEADELFEAIVNMHLESSDFVSRHVAEKIRRENLAYFAGYYDDETRARVERLFKCAHPIFGAIAINGAPTQKEAFELGVALGEKMRKEQMKNG